MALSRHRGCVCLRALWTINLTHVYGDMNQSVCVLAGLYVGGGEKLSRSRIIYTNTGTESYLRALPYFMRFIVIDY